jgi:hypothetical protein
MDEYLFLEMAKLKADRRKLEREEREKTQQHQAHSSDAERRQQTVPELIPLLNWR